MKKTKIELPKTPKIDNIAQAILFCKKVIPNCEIEFKSISGSSYIIEYIVKENEDYFLYDCYNHTEVKEIIEKDLSKEIEIISFDIKNSIFKNIEKNKLEFNGKNFSINLFENDSIFIRVNYYTPPQGYRDLYITFYDKKHPRFGKYPQARYNFKECCCHIYNFSLVQYVDCVTYKSPESVSKLINSHRTIFKNLIKDGVVKI